MSTNQNPSKTVIIGATGGIGLEVSKELQKKGRSLHLIARNEEKLKSLASEHQSSYSAFDASSFDLLQADLDNLINEGSSINSIINCAGSVILKPAHLTSQKEFEETISKNLTTAFSAVRAANKLEQNGSIVLCSTAAVRVGLQNHEAIAAAKGGVEGLVRSAASTYASKGIRVNAVAPGLTKTPMTEKITQNPQALKFSTAMHALGKIGEPRNVASAICWLVNPEQSWVTGQILAVDGGLSSVMAKRA